MPGILLRNASLALAFAAALVLAPIAPASANQPERVQVTGEVVDTWCYVSQIMYAVGTAHHRCAVWCAVGGVPVSIVDEDENVYVILKIEGDDNTVASPTVIDFQTHEVTVDGMLYERDGVKYLLVEQVLADGGIVNMSHEEIPIQP